MAVTCDHCGTVVTASQDTPYLFGSHWHLHRTGRCSNCGTEFQWHRGVAGRSGTGYLAGPRAKPCPVTCPQHKPDVASGDRL